MSTLTVTTTYDTAQILYEAQIDEIKTPIETYFNTTQIDGDNIQANILDGATYLSDDSISADKLASNAVTTAKLADSTPSSDTGITTAKINTDAVTTAKLDDLAVTTAKIDDGDVTTAKIGGAVPKSIMLELPTASTTLSDMNLDRSSTSLSLGSDTAETLVGSLTFSGLTSGKPILINLQSTSTAAGYGYIEGLSCNIWVDGANSPSNFRTTQRVEYALILKKDATTVAQQHYAVGDVFETQLYTRFPLSAFTYVDIASSTSHTYSLYIKGFGIRSYNIFDVEYTATSLHPYAYVGPGSFGIDKLSINSAKLVAIQLV